ncbi:MAG: methyltransferase domain-containing protein [Polyangiales bacterium]
MTDLTVPADELRAPWPRCPVCDGAAPGARVLTLQDAPRVEMRECPHCGAMSAERIPTDAFLTKLYDPAHYGSSLVSNPTLHRRLADRLSANASFSPEKPLEILDYGGSTGALSESVRDALKARGHRAEIAITVVDIHAHPGRDGMRFIDPPTFKAEGRAYDFVIAGAVLEHLPEPGPVLADLFAAVAPAGYFYARTPYDVPLHKLLGAHKVKWPRHLHDMGPRFWAATLKNLGERAAPILFQPSIVETSLSSAPLQTVAATVLKFPALAESWLTPSRVRSTGPLWPYVGGWEVLLAFRR